MIGIKIAIDPFPANVHGERQEAWRGKCFFFPCSFNGRRWREFSDAESALQIARASRRVCNGSVCRFMVLGAFKEGAPATLFTKDSLAKRLELNSSRASYENGPREEPLPLQN